MAYGRIRPKAELPERPANASPSNGTTGPSALSAHLARVIFRGLDPLAHSKETRPGPICEVDSRSDGDREPEVRDSLSIGESQSQREQSAHPGPLGAYLDQAMIRGLDPVSTAGPAIGLRAPDVASMV